MNEQQIEQFLIEKLIDLKYDYRHDIRDREKLEENFRKHFDSLNRVTLTDGEFRRLLDEIVSPDVFASARILRERNSFTRDDGTPLNYTLVNIKDWCKNTFEVVNQLRINTDNSFQRYDVMLLINGIPAVQIELKTLGISPRRAMQQIVDYKKDPGNGYTKTLLCFVQLFIVSNKTETYYFANNNDRHFAFDADENFLPIYQHAAEDNTKITHIDDFAEAFLPKCTLATTISRYMVLVANEQKMLMMRPYQNYAVKAIDQCIRENRGNGYIWHTTGSGKTLTSFKASTLLKLNSDIHKCLFVVDRKDLDRQTRDEFNKFQENCVEENTNTAALVRRLASDDHADIRTRQAVLHSEEFKALWDRIKHKTTYRVQFDNARLVEDCIKAVRDCPPIARTRLQWRIADLSIGKGGVDAKERAGADLVALDEGDIELPDLLTDLQDKTHLTRKSLVRILTESKRLDDFTRNPQQFIEYAAEAINRTKRLALVDSIRYRRIGDDDYYAQELFESEELTGYLRNMLTAEKSVYESVVYDSDTEKSFADQLEKNTSVKVYAKLPGWFKVQTPLGSYNPDWAILVEQVGRDRLYFVVETKGSLWFDDLRSAETAKIKCGEKHFEALAIGDNPATFKRANRLEDVIG